MDTYQSLYEFILLAEKNRKYPANTAHGKRAALKLFEAVLHPDELEDLALVEERMKEIFLSLISKYKETYNIQSLNTYKGRLLTTIRDYKRYGKDTQAFGNWEVKNYRKKDKEATQDTKKDNQLSDISFPVHKHVYKLQIALEDGVTCTMELPPRITKQDVAIITKIITSLAD